MPASGSWPSNNVIVTASAPYETSTWSSTEHGATPVTKSIVTVQSSSPTFAVPKAIGWTSAIPGVGSTNWGWTTGGSSPGQGVKPTDASGPEPFVTVVPQRGVAVPVPGDGSAGSAPAAPGAEPPAERSCPAVPDPAADAAATAPMITVRAIASEIVAVLDTCG